MIIKGFDESLQFEIRICIKIFSGLFLINDINARKYKTRGLYPVWTACSCFDYPIGTAVALHKFQLSISSEAGDTAFSFISATVLMPFAGGTACVQTGLRQLVLRYSCLPAGDNHLLPSHHRGSALRALHSSARHSLLVRNFLTAGWAYAATARP